MGHTDTWHWYVTGEQISTHQLTLARYYSLLGSYISLIDAQGSLNTEKVPFCDVMVIIVSLHNTLS